MCSRTEPPGGALRALARDDGQSTVEATFALPIVLLLVLLLVQPGIILYDRIVMEAAAAEGCRLLATSNEGSSVEAFLRRRLSAVPEQDLFHVHGSGCTWDIELHGRESSSEVSVSIYNEVTPVPLIGAGAQALGLTNSRGNLEIEVRASQPTQPDWATEAGITPRGWVNAWDG